MFHKITLLITFFSQFFIQSCLENSSLQQTHSSDFISQGSAKNRYEMDYQEQLAVRRALAQMPAFYGDGQLRWLSGGWNGSVFLFSDSTLMTNKHVVTVSGNNQRPLNQLEYIVFPHIVLYRQDLFQQVKTYEEQRLGRIKSDYQKAKAILKNRITFLQDKNPKNKQQQLYLTAYKADLELLNAHPPIEMADREFISLEDAIKDIWIPIYDREPDMAFIVLKKPLKQLLTKTSIKNLLTDDYFAAKNMYNPKKQGRIFDGTPLYIAGYGRERNDSATDKNKSLKVLKSMTTNNARSLMYQSEPSPVLDYEKDHYYFEKESTLGDSGSRIWVAVDHNNKVFYEPRPLLNKKIAVGINSQTGGGEYFSKESLEKLFQQFSFRHPEIVSREFSSIPLEPLISLKESVSIAALLNWDSTTDPVFKKKLYIYSAINYFIHQHISHDYERKRLFEIISLLLWIKLQNDPTLGQTNPIDGSFYGYFSLGHDLLEKVAITGIAHTLGALSPSELSQSQWMSFLKNAYELPQTHEKLLEHFFKALATDKQTEANKNTLKSFVQTIIKEEKLLLSRFVDNTLFDEFGPHYSVRPSNLSKEISLKDYLSALSAWVEKNAFNPNYALIYPALDKVPTAIFHSLDEILALDH